MCSLHSGNTLPPELVYCILDYVLCEARTALHDRPDYSTLLDCSLVCRAWAGPSQQLLYYAVHIQTFESVATFLDVTSRRSHLAASVRVLFLAAPPRRESAYPTVPRYDARFTLCTAVSLILACPSVHEIVWHHWTQPQYVTPTIREALVAAKTVRALRLHAVDASFGCTLMDIWPAVEFLDLELVKPAADVTLQRRPQRNLRHLVIAHRVWKWGSDFSASHIRNVEVKMLERLSCDDQVAERSILRLMTHAYQSLRSVTLSIWTEQTSAALQDCPNLAQLVLWKPTTIGLHTKSFLSSLPRSLRHLVLHVGAACRLDHCDGAAETRAVLVHVTEHLPSLRCFTTYPAPQYFRSSAPSLQWNLATWETECVLGCIACGVEVERRDRAEAFYHVRLCQPFKFLKTHTTLQIPFTGTSWTPST